MTGVIIKDLNILGGEPVFRGTRVPFKILIDYLEGGDALDQFLEEYPSVSRELAIAAIEEARLKPRVAAQMNMKSEVKEGFLAPRTPVGMVFGVVGSYSWSTSIPGQIRS
ncbi:MAG: DUF433 domain-containing protein [Candidatus Acidiferrum sp.]